MKEPTLRKNGKYMVDMHISVTLERIHFAAAILEYSIDESEWPRSKAELERWAREYISHNGTEKAYWIGDKEDFTQSQINRAEFRVAELIEEFHWQLEASSVVSESEKGSE